MEKNDFIFGIRAVIEAVEAGRQIDKLLVKKDLHGPLAEELMALVREHRIVTQRVPVERLNRITRKNHQGVIAMVASVNYYTLEPLDLPSRMPIVSYHYLLVSGKFYSS